MTGAAGFIGFHMCKALMAEGHEVYGLDNINGYYDVRLKHSRLELLGIQTDKLVQGKAIAGDKGLMLIELVKKPWLCVLFLLYCTKRICQD